jgi:hypothetical protein
MSSSESFGSWSQEELAESLERGLAGPLIDGSAPPADRFYACTVNALRKYAKAYSTQVTSSIFFLSPEVPESLLNLKEFHTGRRLNSGDSKLGGRVWFVNSRVERGQYFEFDSSKLNETIEFLMGHGLENSAAVVYSPKDQEQAVTFFAQGLDEDSTLSISLTPASVTAEKLKDGIDKLYKGTLVTPHQASSTNAKIWTDAGKWYPAENVEKEIQGRLQSYFHGWFSCNLLVFSEMSTAEGRLDMLLVSPDSVKGRMISHALIELKALRSFSHTGATPYLLHDHMDWIDKGTRQAIAYQSVHNPLHTVLCCFDMCKDEFTDDYWFSKSKELAEKSEVLQWRWRLYNSAEAYRVATFN